MATEQPTMATEFTQLPAQNTVPSGENPLAKHFRTPAVQIKLPSGGKYWGLGSLRTSTTGEYAVYPMTAKDEIIFNNPDALLNGQAVVDVIKSCIPNIVNAWDMPSIDVDRVLIGIRIASYGEEMDFEAQCPKCEETNSFALDLKNFIDKTPDISIFESPKKYAGLEFIFVPQTYKNINDINLEIFEQQRLFNTVNDETIMDEQKLSQVNQLIKGMTDRTVTSIASSIASIRTPDGIEVTDQKYIVEFLNNCDRKVFQFVQECMDGITKALGLHEVTMHCPECQNDYTTPFTFDQANFFDTGS